MEIILRYNTSTSFSRDPVSPGGCKTKRTVARAEWTLAIQNCFAVVVPRSSDFVWSCASRCRCWGGRDDKGRRKEKLPGEFLCPSMYGEFPINETGKYGFHSSDE
eukprot:scaffold4467_cov53-Cyclotella_meneghiniana.AAC.1